MLNRLVVSAKPMAHVSILCLVPGGDLGFAESRRSQGIPQEPLVFFLQEECFYVILYSLRQEEGMIPKSVCQ